jgi:hypothetical protein
MNTDGKLSSQQFSNAWPQSSAGNTATPMQFTYDHITGPLTYDSRPLRVTCSVDTRQGSLQAVRMDYYVVLHWERGQESESGPFGDQEAADVFMAAAITKPGVMSVRVIKRVRVD